MYLVKVKQGRNQGFGDMVQNLGFGACGVLEATDLQYEAFPVVNLDVFPSSTSLQKGARRKPCISL